MTGWTRAKTDCTCYRDKAEHSGKRTLKIKGAPYRGVGRHEGRGRHLRQHDLLRDGGDGEAGNNDGNGKDGRLLRAHVRNEAKRDRGRETRR